MNGIATSPTRIRAASWLGLWALATWAVLGLHDSPIAGEHSICGPWGCGPTIPALFAAHGFWLMVAIPGSLLAGRWLAKKRAIAIGWACLGLGVAGIAAVSVGELTSRPERYRPGARAYTAERILFAIATTVDVPLVPMALAGMILLHRGRRPSPAIALPGSNAMEEADACDGLLCALPAPRALFRPVGRIEVGKPLPELRLLAQDGTTLVVPADLAGRPTVLYFMRAAGCSICRKHVRALVGFRDQLRALNTGVVVVHPGGGATSGALAESLAAPFPFASGRDSGAYDTLGLSDRSFGVFRGCGTILVDHLGLVRYARLSPLPFGAFSGPELREAARMLEREYALKNIV